MSEFDTVIWIGTGAFFLALPPVTYFIIDYGILRTLKRDKVPFYKSRLGVLWFSLGAILELLIVVTLTSRILGQLYGPNWAGREWVTLGAYTLVAALSYFMAIVYAIEKRHPLTPALESEPGQ